MKLGGTGEKIPSHPLHLIHHFRWQVVINSQGLNGSVGNISLVHFFMSPSSNKQQTPPFQEKLMDPSSLCLLFYKGSFLPWGAFTASPTLPVSPFLRKKQISLFRLWFPAAARGHLVHFRPYFMSNTEFLWIIFLPSAVTCLTQLRHLDQKLCKLSEPVKTPNSVSPN